VVLLPLRVEVALLVDSLLLSVLLPPLRWRSSNRGSNWE
jgi:hypothetical protein